MVERAWDAPRCGWAKLNRPVEAGERRAATT